MDGGRQNATLRHEPGKAEGSLIFHKEDGLYYRVNRSTHSAFYFICVHGACNGRAIFNLREGFRHTQRHNHPPEPLRHEVLAMRRSIVDRARTVEYVSFVEIIEEERRRTPNRAIRQELTYRRLRSAMQRAREDMFPPLPATLRELTVLLLDPTWEYLTRTNDLQDSIYSGSVNALDGSHSMIFLSERCVEYMREASILFADGTFKITPAIGGCYQVFTIVTIAFGTVIPLCWILMERKSEHAYIAVLLHIRARLRNWNFTRVISDFEDAIINAFEAVFHVPVQGCFFHCVNDMCTWARSNLTVHAIQIFPGVQDVVRFCCALPLLPQYLLQRGYDVIHAYTATQGPLVNVIAAPFLDYVQNDWIRHVNRGRTLSVAGSVHRTNNASESNNRRMNRRMKVHNPNTYLLVRSFANFEDASVDDMCSLKNGIIPSRHRSPTAISNDLLIQELTNQLLQNPNPTDQQILYFLHCASYSVERAMNHAIGLP